jgi:hypothetical protein
MEQNMVCNMYYSYKIQHFFIKFRLLFSILLTPPLWIFQSSLILWRIYPMHEMLNHRNLETRMQQNRITDWINTLLGDSSVNAWIAQQWVRVTWPLRFLLETSISCGLVPLQWSFSNCYILSLLKGARPERLPDKFRSIQVHYLHPKFSLSPPSLPHLTL